MKTIFIGKHYFLAMILLFLMSSSLWAYASDRHDYESYHQKKSEKMGHRVIHYLERAVGLSDSQEDEIEAIFYDTAKEMEAMRKTHHEQMSTIWNQDSLSASDLENLWNRESHKAQMKNRMADVIVKIHAILTPQQRAEIAEDPHIMKSIFSPHKMGYGMGHGKRGHRGGKKWYHFYDDDDDDDDR